MAKPRTKVVDENGNVYDSIADLSRILKKARSGISQLLYRDGFYKYGGHTFAIYKEDDEIIELPTRDERNSIPVSTPDSDPQWKMLQERYSPEEIELLLKGEGLQDKTLMRPKVSLHGRHHKIGVMSDGHLGSKYSPEDWHLMAFREFEEQGCECILHCGDLVEGLTPRRVSTQIYELSHIGYKAQKEYAIEIFSQCELPVYAISGNHDGFFVEYAGANIVEDICAELSNMTYLGDNLADIEVDSATIRLSHGNDGSAYSYSYKLQKAVEAFPVGKKPNILLQGHYHKFNWCYIRGVHAVSCPSLQMQTPWMSGKRLEAHTGFLVIEFDVDNGSICNFQVRLYPFYA